ncbi:MAG: hypothetical protein K8R91_01395 [Phycisphaerae bacterium]|nr:hypothetical protein [Phycisphaerae bacterium]
MVEIVSGRQALACKSHTTDQTKPLQLKTGEKIEIGERKPESKGWIWCIDSMGLEGWVPESYLAKNNEGVFARYDYSARELTVRIGEILVTGRQESGWAWCTNTSGQSGWVPDNCLHNL